MTATIGYEDFLRQKANFDTRCGFTITDEEVNP